jgi:nucleotide-binding universal stress UspA family protein
LSRLLEKAGVTAPIEVLAGPAAPALREIALADHGDLLVVGRGSSQSGLQRIWSNLYTIIRESPCPVLSI